MQDRRLYFFTIMATAACASPPRQAVSSTFGDATLPDRIVCPAVPDVQELLNRHARTFGSKDAVARALPRSMTGEVVTKGKRGSVQLKLDRDGRFSQATVIDGMLSATGVDATGPWVLPNAGVTIRLRADEAVDVTFSEWLQNRNYLVAFDAKRDTAKCLNGTAGPLILLHFQLPVFGEPELVFGLSDATLQSVQHRDVNDRDSVVSFREWSPPDPSGIRWPRAIYSKDISGNESTITWTSNVAGIGCASNSPENCLAPPPSALAFSWPTDTPVHVPAAFFMNEVFLHAKIGGRSFWGLVDSGATLNVIDAGSPLANALHSTSDGRSQFALGEIREAVELGSLIVNNFPAASIPIPSFSEFGQRRPEILFGYPIFLGTAVRIDYAHQEFLLSRDASNLHSETAIAIPLKIVDQVVVAKASIDGVTGWFVLDSGDSESLDLFQDWAERNGFPGSRPAYAFQQHSEFGNKLTEERRMRPAFFELGPIHINAPLVAIDSVSSPSRQVAGQLGNGVFARCTAVVFDIQNRILWLEPPCDRNLPEDLAGWVLERKDSAAEPEHPWVVRFIIPGGSADVAGVKVGDRLLQIGSKPAILERSNFDAETKQVPGNKVQAIVQRDGKRHELTLLMVRLP